MITPLFHTKGENGADFLCLSYVPVKYGKGLPAVLAIYFCDQKGFTRFSLECIGEEGASYSWTSGSDSIRSIEFVLLKQLVESSIQPAAWRLFPRSGISLELKTDEYEEARKELCKILYVFRGMENIKMSLGEDIPRMICGEEAESGALMFNDEDREEILMANGLTLKMWGY